MSETFHEESTLEEQFIILADGIVAFYDNLEAIQDYTTRTFDNPNDAAENFIALYKELGHKADVITKASNAIRSYCKEEISLAMVEVGVDGFQTDAGKATVSKPSMRGSVKKAREFNRYLTNNDLRVVSAKGQDLGPLGEVIAPWVTVKHSPGTLRIT